VRIVCLQAYFRSVGQFPLLDNQPPNISPPNANPKCNPNCNPYNPNTNPILTVTLTPLTLS